MLLAAMNYSNALAFGLAFWLGAIGFVTMHETHANLLNCCLELRPSEATFAGETVWQPIQIENLGRKPRISLQIATQRHPPAGLPPMNCQTQILGHFQWQPPQRGVHPVPRFAISSQWPLGLFRAWSWVHAQSEHIVYPKPADAVSAPPFRHSSAAGESHATPNGEELAGLRDYQAGDNPRRIHWRSLAAHDQLATKAFDAPHGDVIWLDYALLTAEHSEEESLSILCRHVLDLHAIGKPFGLRLGKHTIPPDHGVLHRDRCLETLARFSSTDASA